ncbi:MAG: valine--tRNA ligase [Patescibacteria group bacterium]
MATELEKAYQSKKVEDKIYRRWESSGFFNPDQLPSIRYPLSAKPFTVIMPPPNANGPLHIGHAVFVTLQDIMIRFWRMRGRRALWLPGADHAGFETQVVFDKKLEKQGRHRSDIPRDQLYARMLEFTLENKKVMEAQLRKLGASCDWSRERFTLDPEIVKIVTDTFFKLYEDGLLYRGERIVNWCVKHQTTLSDLEVRYEERTDPLYYIKYGPLTLATVRPETKFGDTAVAVHPSDRRFRQYVGKEIEIETLIGPSKIKVITDEAVDPKFGTGVIKVTPAHDPADFEIGKRHNLEVRSVIGKDGSLNEKTGPYAGLKVAAARQKVAEDMQKKGLLVKVDPTYKHNVAVCYKCGTVVEPLVMPQWFVKMQPLAAKATTAVESGKIRIIPERYKKVYFHWLKNISDWNISRQIVWGIRIPAWLCQEMRNPKCKVQNGVIVSRTPPVSCLHCGSKELIQDPDVLDTWFSSGQWPYAVLGYPDSKDFKTFYPTDVMETGYDILFFWVARMIMLGLYSTGKVPFRTVYLHGLVRDKDRQKMSKSKGNVIDPLGVAELYGTDAVRMALTVGNLPGQDIIISEEKIRGYRNFANKLWNIHRFIMLNYRPTLTKTKPRLSAGDKRRVTELKSLVKKTTEYLEQFKFHHASDLLYHYTWHTFADKIIESVKPRLSGEDHADRAAAQSLLIEIHQTVLKLLHPFMPFITEELWQNLHEVKSPAKGEARQRRQKSKVKSLLMIEPWPR